jgi:hypothetical protein
MKTVMQLAIIPQLMIGVIEDGFSSRNGIRGISLRHCWLEHWWQKVGSHLDWSADSESMRWLVSTQSVVVDSVLAMCLDLS